MDYDRTEFSPSEIQMKYFERQFDLASEFKLPMFFHDRNTCGDFKRIVSQYRSKFTTGVVHSFTGTLTEMKDYVEMGLYIGINGCSLKTKDNLLVVREVPLDRLMIETDAPWCDLRPSHASHAHNRHVPIKSNKKEKFVSGEMVKGRNEPANLHAIVSVIAAIKEIPVEAVATQTFKNSIQIFNLNKNGG